jgi:hypothetical protein
MVMREADCDGKRIPTFPISCLSGVLQRVCCPFFPGFEGKAMAGVLMLMLTRHTWV